MPTAHTDPAGLSFTWLDDVFGRAGVVGRLHDVPRHFGMHDDADARDAARAAVSICRTVKRVWTEQWPFHRMMRARFTASGSSPPQISFGSHTTISSSGTPIL